MCLDLWNWLYQMPNFEKGKKISYNAKKTSIFQRFLDEFVDRYLHLKYNVHERMHYGIST